MTGLKKVIFIGMLVLAGTVSFVQTNPPDTVQPKKIPAVKAKSYAKFEKRNCNLDKYYDDSEAKELFCKANYFLSRKENAKSIECLKQAFNAGRSVEFKFRVMKLLMENYRALGNVNLAESYKTKLDKILEEFPEIDN